MIRLARFMVYGAVVATVVGLSLFHAARVADPPYEFVDSFRFGWALAYILVLGIAAYGAGLPDLPRSVRSALLAAVASAGAAALAMSVLQLLTGDSLLPRFVVFGSVMILVPWYLVCVLVASGGRSRAEDRDVVVIISLQEEAASLERDLAYRPERPATLAGAVHIGDVTPDADHPEPLVVLANERKASVVVLGRSALADDNLVAQVAKLHEHGVRIRTLSLFYEEWLGKLPLSELERVSLMFDIGEVHRSRYTRATRIADFVVAAVGMVLLVPVTLIVLVGNVVANRGPLLFRQLRVGKDGELFDIVKFRTMRPSTNADTPNEMSGAGNWTGEDDPRITPWGRILRRSHLDELPQMWNILTGDLSLVGPRPEQPHYVAELSAALPFYNLRHLVRPGLTGWAQVKYHYAADEADAMEKLQYEFYYLRHQGLMFDLRILGRTVRSVLGREGR